VKLAGWASVTKDLGLSTSNSFVAPPKCRQHASTASKIEGCVSSKLAV